MRHATAKSNILIPDAIDAIAALTTLLRTHATPSKHQGVNWGEGACPAPAADQLSGGYLKIEDGETLKCQFRPYVSNMSCQGITDNTKVDGVVCGDGSKSIIFLFDEKGVLKMHRWLTKKEY